MGHNISSINGVKSDNFYEQGNGINEIWVDDLEIISRLPFGDSDLGQAGWPKGNWPKIPWHQFIIPLKRDLGLISNISSTNNTPTMTETLTCCPCLKSYPEVGYFGMYKNWNPHIAGYFGTGITYIGIYMLVYLVFVLQWEQVVMELHGFMPDNPGVSEAVERPPNRAESWLVVKPWLWRHCFKNLLIFVPAILLVMCGIPGAIQTAKSLSGPEVFVETWKWIAIWIAVFVGFQFAGNMYLLHSWRCSARKDADRLRGLEHNPGQEMRIVTWGNPGLLVMELTAMEKSKAEEA